MCVFWTYKESNGGNGLSGINRKTFIEIFYGKELVLRGKGTALRLFCHFFFVSFTGVTESQMRERKRKERERERVAVEGEG